MTALISGCVLANRTNRYFKQLADAAAPSNLMAYLFSRERVKQSVRLGFAGAWDHDHPELRPMLDQIQRNCPHLIRSFTPRYEHDLMVNDDIDVEADITVQEDINHANVQISLKGFVLLDTNNSLRLTASINLRRQSVTSRCIRQLGNAFARDYQVDNILEFESCRLQWRTRLAWTCPKTMRRWVFNVGDFSVVLRRDRRSQNVNLAVIRLAQLFVYRFLDKPYLFLIGNMVEEVIDEDTGAVMEDPTLELSVWKVSNSQVIYGLPAVDAQAVYFIPVPPEGPWVGRPVEAGEEFVLLCCWNISFL
jgi:hypothetical protein